jgi:hypothetical protein
MTSLRKGKSLLAISRVVREICVANDANLQFWVSFDLLFTLLKTALQSCINIFSFGNLSIIDLRINYSFGQLPIMFVR